MQEMAIHRLNGRKQHDGSVSLDGALIFFPLELTPPTLPCYHLYNQSY
jgi:hypothetical protein